MSKHHRPEQRPALRPQELPPPPLGAWWNAIARRWLVEGEAEAGPVPVEPQPAPPSAATVPPAPRIDL